MLLDEYIADLEKIVTKYENYPTMKYYLDDLRALINKIKSGLIININ